MPTPKKPAVDPATLLANFDPRKMAEAQKAIEEMKRRGLVPAGVALPDLTALANLARGLDPAAKPASPEKPKKGKSKTVKKKKTQAVTPPPAETCQSYAVPQSRKALILTAGIDGTLTFPDDLKSMLESRGYLVERRRMTLEELRNLPGQDLGVLVVVGHGESGLVNGDTSPNRYTLVVEAEIDPKSPAHKRDLADEKAKRAKYTRENELLVLDPVRKKATKGDPFIGWSANMDFFTQYWAGKKIFSRDSVVYFASCDLSCPDYINLIRACGAGTLIAWDNYISFDIAEKAGRFIFDRLLGADSPGKGYFDAKNDFRDPVPQRPWAWVEIVQNFPFHKSSSGTPLNGPYSSLYGTKLTRLQVFADNGAGACLAPAIHELRVDEAAKELILSGWLGPDPKGKGRVWLQDVARSSGQALPLKVKPGGWDGMAGTVTCELPALGSFTAGYVVVEVDGRRSNTVPLTEWVGEIIYTAYGDGSLQEEGRLNFRLRMGAYNPRRLFNQEVSAASYQPAPIPSTTAAPDSSLRVVASGSASYSSSPSGIVQQSVQGSATFKARSAAGSAGASLAKTFEVVLGLQKKFGVIPQEKIETVWQILLPQGAANSSSGHEWKIKYKDGREETKPLPVLREMLTLKAEFKQSDLKNYEFPPLEVIKDVGSAPWKRVTMRLTCKVNFPPDWSRGEDYSSPPR